MIKHLALLVLYSIFSISLFAQTDDSIVVAVYSKVYNFDKEVIWSLDSVEQTTDGEKVQVRIVGKTLVVLAEFTPYVQDQGNYLLVSQGQVWVKEEEADTMNYRTAMNALRVNEQEVVFFYPLGLTLDQVSPETSVLEMQIVINPEGVSLSEDEIEDKSSESVIESEETITGEAEL